jgi:hypothetical protein
MESIVFPAHLISALTGRHLYVTRNQAIYKILEKYNIELLRKIVNLKRDEKIKKQMEIIVDSFPNIDHIEIKKKLGDKKSPISIIEESIIKINNQIDEMAKIINHQKNIVETAKPIENITIIKNSLIENEEKRKKLTETYDKLKIIKNDPTKIVEIPKQLSETTLEKSVNEITEDASKITSYVDNETSTTRKRILQEAVESAEIRKTGMREESKILKEVKGTEGKYFCKKFGNYKIIGITDGCEYENNELISVIEIKTRVNRFMKPQYDLDQLATYVYISSAKNGKLVQKWNGKIQEEYIDNLNERFEKLLKPRLDKVAKLILEIENDPIKGYEIVKEFI